MALLDMTDPSQSCPNGFRLETRSDAPQRTCGRPKTLIGGYTSTNFSTYGIEYSKVCGRIKSYHRGLLDAFFQHSNNQDIDSGYVDGISLTHGQSPRQHIWT